MRRQRPGARDATGTCGAADPGDPEDPDLMSEALDALAARARELFPAADGAGVELQHARFFVDPGGRQVSASVRRDPSFEHARSGPRRVTGRERSAGR